jgi:tetratricopeptide (TPR) repeat protein
MSEGSYHEAVEHYERALEIEPDNPDVLYAHAVGLMSISSYAQALDELDRVMELTNIDRLRDELFYSWRSIALFNLRRYEEAVSDCEAYVLKNPDDPDGQSLLDNMKRVRDSSDSDRGSKSQYVRPPQLLFGRWGVSDSALASFATWDRIWGEDRLPFLNQQLELEPDDRMFEEWALLVNRGDELLWAGSNEEALNDFSRALELRPDNAYIWAFRGMALEHLDRLDEALIEYNRAIDLQPDMREKLGMNPDLSVEESSG